MKKVLFFLGLALTFSSFLQAEIVNIVIKWNAFSCANICVSSLQNNLRSINGITDLVINPMAGVAEIEWNPRIPFNFYSFSIASRTIGIRINDVRLRVKGTIFHVGNNIFLNSLGDGSQFLLLGPIQPQASTYIIQQNVASHPISAELREKLLDAERRQEIVTVEGPLFEPYRYNLTLEIEQIDIPPPKIFRLNRHSRYYGY